MADITYKALQGAGLYVRLTARDSFATGAGDEGNLLEILTPLTTETFSEPSDRQEYFQPIMQLFDEVRNSLNSLTNVVTFGLDIASKFQDLFGHKFFQFSLYRKAWKNPVPSQISIKLTFNFGMLNKFNAKDEVIRPLYLIKSNTLPSFTFGNRDKGVLKAPGPNAMSVYTEFASDLIPSVIKDLGGSLLASTKTSEDTQQLSTNEQKLRSSLNTLKAPTNTQKVWFLQLIAIGGSTESKNVVYESPPLVCERSQVEYSNQIDDTLSPIWGSINLDFSSQVPATSDIYNLTKV